jgi:DnaJ like chaperone protein
MSIWLRISEALAALTSGEGLRDVLERLRTPPERSVAFTIATIALGAKMAKADGQVTRDEVTAFRAVFTIPPSQTANAARVFDMARTDVAGFDAYARQIARMFTTGSDTLRDLLEGLFYIAMADGQYHPNEADFLQEVARIFGISDRQFAAIRARFVPGAEPDCYTILGVTPDTPLPEIKSAWRALVIDSHPDRMMARGLPEEAIKLAEKRLIAINAAWENVSSNHPDA